VISAVQSALSIFICRILDPRASMSAASWSVDGMDEKKREELE
jgi:hypothetical protein